MDRILGVGVGVRFGHPAPLLPSVGVGDQSE